MQRQIRHSCGCYMQGQDLASGNLTAPAIFALASESSDSQHLRELIESEFLEDQDLKEAMQIIKEGDGLAAARRLARQESDLVRLRTSFDEGTMQICCMHSLASLFMIGRVMGLAGCMIMDTGSLRHWHY